MSVIDRKRWLVLEPLLDRALNLTDVAQSAWLQELAATAPDLASDLAALLSGESEADRDGFLDAPLDLAIADFALGAYTLDRPVGHGGMGSVWLAHRTDGRFEGQAAIKLLNVALLTSSGQERFRREGSALARLTHPGIARLLDAGVSDDGQPFLVLEYVDGKPIDVYADDHDLDRTQRIRLVMQVLAAVEHAHTNLVVHRDLKPSNILVTADGTVKLLDFGIATVLDAEGASARTGTAAEGAHALTPQFAAPEQALNGAITTATDVYALGTLLYLIVAGRHPTAEGSRTGADAVKRLLEVTPAPLGLGDLDSILDRALQKEPRLRYQTVAAFAEDLEHYLNHEPVSTRTRSLAYRSRLFLRRHRPGVATAVVTLAALIAATVFSVRQMREAERQRDAAVAARRRVDAQVEFQSALMSQFSDRPITMRDVLDHGRDFLEKQYSGDPRVLSAMLTQLSERYAELGDYKSRANILVRAESIAVAGHFIPELAEIRCQAASGYRTENRYDDARHNLASADSLLGIVYDRDIQARCLQLHADLETETGHSDVALVLVRRAIAMRDSLDRAPGHVDLLNTLSEALDHNGQPREAITTMRHAVRMLDSTGRGGMMQRIIFQHNLAYALIRIGEMAEAERLVADALHRIAGTDPNGKFPSQPLIHYASTALFDGHLDSARKYYTVLAQQAVSDSNRYWQGRALFGLVQADVRSGRLTEARDAAARFHALGPDRDLVRTDDQIVDGRLVDAWLAHGVHDDSTALAQTMAVLRDQGYFTGTTRRTFHVALIFAAERALALHDAPRALRFARDAHATALRDPLSDIRSAYAGEASLLEARALLAMGDRTRARLSAARALTALRAGAGEVHPRTIEAGALARTLGR